MNIKETEIKNNTLSIKSYIEELATAAERLNNEREKISRNEYISDSGKESERNRLTTEYKAQAEKIVDKIITSLESIKMFCVENEATFSPEDRTLNNVLDIIEHLQSNIPTNITEKYISYFKGNNTALNILSIAFEKHGINTNASKYIINTDSKYNELINLAKNTAFDDKNIVISLLSLYRGIINTAEDIGVHFTDEEKESKIEMCFNGLQNNFAKSVMGII